MNKIVNKITTLGVGFIGGIVFLIGCNGSPSNEANAAVVTDQLICAPLNPYWVSNINLADCIQASDTENLRSMTISEVLNEGWIAVSGSERSYIFYMHK